MNARWAVAAGVVAAVLAASLVPAPGGVGGGNVVPLVGDKPLHGVGYAAITWAVASAVRARTAGRLAAVVLAATAFGAGVELVQPLVGRTASSPDALANLAGAVAGSLLYALNRSRCSA